MAATSWAVNIPTVAQVVRWNRLLIDKYTGSFVEPDNLLFPDSLSWVLEAVEYPVFGCHPYSTIYQKAAIIAWIIITGHVFHDGNKRTGLFAAGQILQANGHTLTASQDEIVNVALEIATHGESNMTFELLADWFERHSRLS
jgi:death on curing protein